MLTSVIRPLHVHDRASPESAAFAHWHRDISLTSKASLVIHCSHLRLLGELEDERRENRLSASRASCSNAARSDACNCAILHWQIDPGTIYKIRLQTAMTRRGSGVIEPVTPAYVIKLFPQPLVRCDRMHFTQHA
jgi:hypothetical protein